MPELRNWLEYSLYNVHQLHQGGSHHRWRIRLNTTNQVIMASPHWILCFQHGSHLPTPSITSVTRPKQLEAEIGTVEADQRHLGDPRRAVESTPYRLKSTNTRFLGSGAKVGNNQRNKTLQNPSLNRLYLTRGYCSGAFLLCFVSEVNCSFLCAEMKVLLPQFSGFNLWNM